MNAYGFAGGDRVNFSDPMGLKQCPPDCGGWGSLLGIFAASGVPATAPNGETPFYAIVTARVGPVRGTANAGAISGLSLSICATCSTPGSVAAGFGVKARDAAPGEQSTSVGAGPIAVTNQGAELTLSTPDGCILLCVERGVQSGPGQPNVPSPVRPDVTGVKEPVHPGMPGTVTRRR